MHDERSLTAPHAVPPAARAARSGSAAALAEALRASRRDTLATFAVYEAALPRLEVPLRAELNPPLWELGHIGWFQEYWIARNPVRGDGHRADAEAPRHPPRRANADALYHSSHVPHDSRWSLPLPDARATRADLEAQLAESLRVLASVASAPSTRTGPAARARPAADDDALYFYRLALLHEDMHHEAALYMAQSLGIPVDDPRWQAHPLPEPGEAIALDAGTWLLGTPLDAPAGEARGFVFDNEAGHAEVALHGSRIDAQVVRWAEYLPFLEAGGYDLARHWTAAGWAWRQAQAAGCPRYLRRVPATGPAGHGHWERWRHGRWMPLDRREAACHLTLHEAEAWCRWAGRRLPTEAEWECAAITSAGAFAWGEVWEWTSSPFRPFEGFAPHPYRDYSAPWFDGRPVLRGGSFMTQPRMKHPRYRNFFQPHRNDVPAGFRSCTA